MLGGGGKLHAGETVMEQDSGFRPAQNGIMASASEWVQHVSCCPLSRSAAGAAVL